MVKILLKKQFTEIFRAYFYDAKKNKARSKAAVTGYIVLFVFLMVGILGGMFTYLSIALCKPLSAAGLGWLYFAIMGIISILLGAFGSVFNTYSGLYLAKDNDLLLSMPIPVGTIMVSRLLGVYLMGLMYSGVVLIPAAAVYIIIASRFGPVWRFCLRRLFPFVFPLRGRRPRCSFRLCPSSCSVCSFVLRIGSTPSKFP